MANKGSQVFEGKEMTEAEWLTCSDPWLIVNCAEDRLSVRKLRLLACAVCRHNSAFMESPLDRHAVAIVEMDVDGLCAPEGIDELKEDSDMRWYRRDPFDAVSRAINSFSADMWMLEKLDTPTNEEKRRINKLHNLRIVSLFVDITGNPFRPAIFDPRWLTSDVVGLARAIFEDRAYERMPILADALMDAGCEDEAILSHCRGDGVHVRGCWVVDLVLGKESRISATDHEQRRASA